MSNSFRQHVKSNSRYPLYDGAIMQMLVSCNAFSCVILRKIRDRKGNLDGIDDAFLRFSLDKTSMYP